MVLRVTDGMRAAIRIRQEVHMSHATANPSVTIPKPEGTPLAARNAPDNDNTPATEPHTTFPKLDAVIRRQGRLRVMVSCASALLFIAAAVAIASLMFG